MTLTRFIMEELALVALCVVATLVVAAVGGA